MSVEDRVRAATRARAALVRDVRSLDLPAVPARPLRARRWVAWAAPVAAAAAVAAVAASLAAVRHTPDEPVAPAVVPAVSGMLPEYYAALDNPSGPITQIMPGKHQTPVSVRVGDDRTGKLIATVPPPDGQTFAGLTGAADDRTFVVAAEQFPVQPLVPSANTVAWYLLRLNPGSTHPVTLTRLPIPGESAGTQVSAIALAPDGGELAVMFQQNAWQGKTGPLTIRLYSLATGTPARTWTVDTKGSPAGIGWYWGRYSNTTLTWLNGGHTLAVTYGANNSASGPPLTYGFTDVTIRTVDADSRSGSLLAISKVLFHLPNGVGRAGTDCDTVQLTGDGKTVLCGKDAGDTLKPSTEYAPKFAAYSVATGKSRLLYQLPGAYGIGVADVLWASPTGSTLLGSVYTQATWGHGPVDQTVGLLTNGRFKPVKFPLTAVPFAGEIAFLPRRTWSIASGQYFGVTGPGKFSAHLRSTSAASGSHSGSHRRQILSDAGRHAHTIRPARCLIERSQGTYRDAAGVPSNKRVTDSNPAGRTFGFYLVLPGQTSGLTPVDRIGTRRPTRPDARRPCSCRSGRCFACGNDPLPLGSGSAGFLSSDQCFYSGGAKASLMALPAIDVARIQGCRAATRERRWLTARPALGGSAPWARNGRRQQATRRLPSTTQ